MALAHIFHEHARVGLALPGSPDELERTLAQRFEEARAAWPSVDLPAGELVRHVAERIPEGSEGAALGEVLDGLRLSDLYLACACARQVPGAAEALERELLARLPPLLRRQFRDVPDATIEDTCQLLREKLLLGNPPGQPHLLTYSGEGALMSWIRVIGVRTLIKQLRPGVDQPTPDLDAFLPESPADQDLERDVIKRDLHQKFREAVREAVRALLVDPEDRYLLKLHYQDGLSTVKVARLFGVPQPTMWRRLDRLREKILAGSKRLLRERHGIEGEGLRSLISGLESRFDVTLSQLFESEGSPPPGGAR